VEENPLHKTSVFGQAPGGHGNVPDQDGPVESEGLDLAGLQEVGVMVKLWGLFAFAPHCCFITCAAYSLSPEFAFS